MKGAGLWLLGLVPVQLLVLVEKLNMPRLLRISDSARAKELQRLRHRLSDLTLQQAPLLKILNKGCQPRRRHVDALVFPFVSHGFDLTAGIAQAVSAKPSRLSSSSTACSRSISLIRRSSVTRLLRNMNSKPG